jgi:hypothetical protein
MRRFIFWAVLVLALTIIIVIASIAGKRTTMTDDTANSGPFRDGSYLGMLDASHGKVPHLAAGRWSSESDRQSFIRGYKTAYAQTRLLLTQNGASNPNTVASYRDGLYLGKLDAQQGRAEHPSVGRWVESKDKELFVSGYYQAFAVEAARLSATGKSIRVALLR